MANDSKKEIILRILDILNECTDKDHHILQKDIVDKLVKEYGTPCSRVTVARNIEKLKQMGHIINSDYNGYYLLNHTLEKSELRLLIDSVLASKNINAEDSELLIKKLISIGGVDFKSHVKHVYSVKDWNKTQNAVFFRNINLIDEAIDKGVKVSFDYKKLGIDKQLRISQQVVASPYQLILHNQKYYLMLKSEIYDNLSFYRLDKIYNLKVLEKEPMVPIKSLPGEKNGINYNKLSTSFPYLYYDTPHTVIIECDMSIIDEVFEWFGTDISVHKIDDNTFEAKIVAGETAIIYWILQFNTKVKVISPDSLKEKVIQKLQETLDQYK